MDIPVLSQQVVDFLGPLLPYIVKGGIEAGKGASKKIGEKFGEGVWKTAQDLWQKLRGHQEVAQAAQIAAEMPDDPDALIALRLQLKRLLAQNPTLATDLNSLLHSVDSETRNTVIAQGERSVAIGGNVSGSTIITGDKNRIGR